jgi:uncharacterized protein YkwD
MNEFFSNNSPKNKYEKKLNKYLAKEQFRECIAEARSSLYKAGDKGMSYYFITVSYFELFKNSKRLNDSLMYLKKTLSCSKQYDRFIINSKYNKSYVEIKSKLKDEVKAIGNRFFYSDKKSKSKFYFEALAEQFSDTTEEFRFFQLKGTEKLSFLCDRELNEINAVMETNTELNVQLSLEEYKLYQLIMEYRASKGLPKIPLSTSLTFVAQTHCKDVIENDPCQGNCNLHSWSDKGDWTPVCYTSDHAKVEYVWSKPKELTNYQGYGYEISATATPHLDANYALRLWQSSAPHNACMINEGMWSDITWNAIGVGIYNGYSCVWFGKVHDPDLEFTEIEIISIK